MLHHATTDEQRAVAGWVREALATLPEEKYSTWRREQYGGFLLELEADALDDYAFLQICRETGRIGDLVDRKLHLGRLDPAVEEAQRASDHGLLALGDNGPRSWRSGRNEVVAECESATQAEAAWPLSLSDRRLVEAVPQRVCHAHRRSMAAATPPV